MKKLTYAILAAFLSVNAMAARHPAPPAPAPQAAQAAPSPALVTMGQELDREMSVLSKASPAAYFINYTLTSTQRSEVMGSNGALLSSNDSLSRWLETQVRVGSYDLDDTHKVGNSRPADGSYGTAVPLDNAPEVLRRAMWRETDKQYRAASEGLIKINTSKEVQAQTAEEHAPDFSREQPHVSYGPEVSIHVDRKPWEQKVRLYTAAFRQSPQILNSIVTFSALANNQYQANTEGTRLQFGLVHYRLELFIQGKAPDGMDINRYYNFDWNNPGRRPGRQDRARPGTRSAQGAGSAGGRAAGRALCRPRASHRTRYRRVLPRSFRPPRRGIPPEGHQRRPDLRPQSGRTDFAEIPFHLRRPDREGAGQGHAAGLLSL